jgi:ABC-type multidrug transport system permease subunit
VDTKLGYAGGAGSDGVKIWPAYLCFIIFGVLVPFSRPEYKFTTVLYSLVIAIVVGLLAVNLLILAFNSGNTALRMSVRGQ